MRCLLEVIASQAIDSLPQLRVFIESTLLYQLCTAKQCDLCKPTFKFNQSLFGLSQETDEIGQLIDVKADFQEYLSTFDLKKFSHSITSS